MTSELDLFGPDAGRPHGDPLVAGVGAPLAARMRPRSIEEFLGQLDLVGEGGALRELIERDRVPSLILWGPPGCGKTTLAGIVARRTGARFEAFSAVTEGIARVRELIEQARERKRATGQDTILFVDEIHRFNKSQQDAFLPHVEAGTITLIGATTENPSFEVVGPLLSRTRVFVLEPLGPDVVSDLCRRALEDVDRGLGSRDLGIDDEALRKLAESADGDARRALNALETAAHLLPDGAEISLREVEAALQRRFASGPPQGGARLGSGRGPVLAGAHAGRGREPHVHRAPPCADGAGRRWGGGSGGTPRVRGRSRRVPLPGIPGGRARAGTGLRIPGGGAQIQRNPFRYTSGTLRPG